jgi:hypothetical protein
MHAPARRRSDALPLLLVGSVALLLLALPALMRRLVRVR